MLFQINHPDGDSLGILDIENCFQVCQEDFPELLGTIAENCWAKFDDDAFNEHNDFTDVLCEELATIGVKAERVFVTEINI